MFAQCSMTFGPGAMQMDSPLVNAAKSTQGKSHVIQCVLVMFSLHCVACCSHGTCPIPVKHDDLYLPHMPCRIQYIM